MLIGSRAKILPFAPNTVTNQLQFATRLILRLARKGRGGLQRDSTRFKK
ncbi:MAG TPA: hypothetical protein V6C52_10970 [Coleofasciculaceae cyanobacterium]